MSSTRTDGPSIHTDRATAAYRKLRQLIVHGRLAPGTRIIETDVADRLEISRTPVRSALQRLQHEGFLLTSGEGKQVRLVVAPLTRDDAAELFEIVGALEGLGAAHAAERPTEERDEIVARLRQANACLGGLAEEEHPDRDRFFDLDESFHETYFQAGAGSRLRALHRGVKPQAERYIRLYVSTLTRVIHVSVEEHEAIAAAVERGQADEARVAVERNWRNAAQRLFQVIDRLGEWGSW